MNLSQVSRTAILLLICRAVESQKKTPGFNDPLSELCLEKLLSMGSAEDRRWIARLKKRYAGILAQDAKSGAQRGRKIDAMADRFIAEHPTAQWST